MSLVVGPGMAPAVYFEDGYASGDACVNDTVKRSRPAAPARSRATVSWWHTRTAADAASWR